MACDVAETILNLLRQENAPKSIWISISPKVHLLRYGFLWKEGCHGNKEVRICACIHPGAEPGAADSYPAGRGGHRRARHLCGEGIRKKFPAPGVPLPGGQHPAGRRPAGGDRAEAVRAELWRDLQGMVPYHKRDRGGHQSDFHANPGHHPVERTGGAANYGCGACGVCLCGGRGLDRAP